MSRLDGLGLTSWSPWEGGKLPTGRDVATVIALARRLEADNTPDIKNRAVVMLIQLVVLRYTNLSARLFDNTSLSKPALVLHNQFLSGFSADVAKILDMWDEKYASHLTWDLYDLVDGRLLSHIVGGLGTLSLPRARSAELRQLAQRIQDLTNVDLLGDLPGNLVLDSEPDPGINSLTLEDQTTQIPTAAVLPFRHPVLDPFMNKIHVRADASLEPSTRSAIFEELSHWHNSKNSLDPRQRRKPPGFFARKRNQKYMADTIAYSASLTNASGKNIDPEPVIVAKSTGKPSRRGQGPKGGDKPAQQAVQSLQQAKDQKRAASVLAFWEEQCRHFDRDDDPAQRYIKAAKFLSDLPKPSADIVGCEVTLYMCNALASIIAESEEEGEFRNQKVSWQVLR